MDIADLGGEIFFDLRALILPIECAAGPGGLSFIEQPKRIEAQWNRLESSKKAQAERQARIDAYKKHKNEVLAKGGRPVDALDSWMQKNLKKEDYAPAAKLLESGLFTEEEIIKLTIG